MESLRTLQSLIEILRQAGSKDCVLEMQPEGIARWSSGQVADTAEQLARGLVEAGVRRGEFVPVLAANRPEWLIAALGIIGAGAAVSPLDSQIRLEALESVLRDSEARFIFTTTDYLNRLNQIKPDNSLRPVLFDVQPGDARGWRALLSGNNTALPTVQPEEAAALFYTSGTTGTPKGVKLTHQNLVFQLKSVQKANLVKSDDRILLPLPMYHVYPFTVGTLTPLAFGLPIILPQSLTGPQVIRALREGEVSIIVGVPRVYRAMFNGIEGQIAGRGAIVSALFQTALKASIQLRRRYGWRIGKRLFRPLRTVAGPNLRLLASGGSALDPELAWKLEGFGWDIGIGYGLTETSPMLTMNLPSPAVPRLGSVGLPLPGINIRVAPVENSKEDTGKNTSPDEGEIQAQGASVFGGYRNLPDKTAEAFSADGWFKTGDLGYFDEQGYLYISGRASTLIVLEGGKKIQPDPLEEIYQQNPFIREIGILYEKNQLVALIVPEPDPINRLRNGDVEEAIREAVKERVQAVSSYQRITDYAITETPLPRTNLGKIRRHVLTQRFNQAKAGKTPTDAETTGPIAIADMAESDQTLLKQPEARKVWDWLARRYHDKRLTPDTSPQLDLGIDSLEWLTLTLQVSDMTGVELTDEAIGRVSTVRHLLAEVCAAEGDSAVLQASESPESMLTDEQKWWLTPVNPLLRAVGVVLFYSNPISFVRGHTPKNKDYSGTKLLL